jgi:5-methylcytosine-specific restriction protein A
LDGDVERLTPAGSPAPIDLQTLRRRALEATTTPAQATDAASAKRRVYKQNRDIRAYVLARANGQCEACSRTAPFMTASGAPYLEPHHIRRLGDGGPNDPRFMGAVCPNCHREIHHGVNGRTLNEQLQIAVTSREDDLDTR